MTTNHKKSSLFIALAILLCFQWGQAADNRWTSNGPYGGNIGSFVFNPQRTNDVFSTADGIFRSTNGGMTWQRADIPGNIAAALAVHANGTIYAAGTAVFVSQDHGATWQLVANRLPDTFIDLQIDPLNSLILYALSSRQGPFKSTDGGRSWAKKNNGVQAANGGDLEIDPSNGNTLYLLTGTNVYKSTNGAASWQKANNNLQTDALLAIAIDPLHPEVLYAGGENGIFKSTNGTGSWTNTNCNCAVTDIVVDPLNSNNVYGASLGVVKTVDGGKSWKRISLPPPATYLGSVGARGNVIFAGPYGAGIYRSNNGGGSWQPASTGIDVLPVPQISAHAQRPGKLIANGNGTLFQSLNNGGKWSVINSAAAFNSGGVKIHPVNPNLVVAASCCCSPLISENGGNVWRCNNSGFEFNSDDVVLDPQDQNVIYLRSVRQGVAKTTDRGRTWSTINSGISDVHVTALQMNPRDRQNLFAGTESGEIFRTSNGGSNWENSSTGLGAGGVISVAVDPSNSNIVYLTTDYRGKGVYKSTDGGRSWKLKNKGLSGAPFSLTVDPSTPTTIYAGGYGGVAVTADGAENWSRFPSDGLGLFIVFDVVISPNSPNMLFAGTQHGVFGYSRTTVPGGPLIEQVTPSNGKAGDTITISGRNFGPAQGNSKVFFGAVDAGTVQSWSDQRIATKVPQGAQTGQITVVVASRRSNPFEFLIISPSSKVAPPSGPKEGGTQVTIMGPSGLSNSIFFVLFGKSLARNLGISPPNIITCETPPGTGTVEVILVRGFNFFRIGTFTYQ